jgi:riboflavin-specific deaminase-like protein
MVVVTTLSELTIDGKLSLGRGASSKELFDFYGDELRVWFHQQRAVHDAIMVGAATVRADDPLLTVRFGGGPNPLRVVPASTGDLPLGAALLNDGLPTLVVVSEAAPDHVVAALREKPQVEVIYCGETQINLRELLSQLDTRGVGTLVAEGGSRLLHSLFAARLVDRIIIKHIPVISGAGDAPAYLQSSSEGADLRLSRWRVTEWFVKGGVGVSVYEALNAGRDLT